LCPYQVGDPYSWIPDAFTNHSEDSSGVLGAVVRLNGRVVQVHEEHRWFRVEATFPGGTLRECFKFI